MIRFRLIILMCLILLGQAATAQSAIWIDMSSNIPTSVTNANLTDVASVGTTVWISCSNLKGIFCSSDGGNTFTFHDLGVGIQGLYRFSDGVSGWCVGGAYGFKTVDAGESWNPVFIGSTLLSITFANNLVGYATGTGSVYRTDDGGATWAKKTTIANLYNKDVMDATFPDPLNPYIGYVCVANEISTIFKTSDGGDAWETVTLSGVTSSVNDLEFTSPTLGWAVGGESNIFRFENTTWNIMNAPFTVSLNAVTTVPGSDDCRAVGNAGTIFQYTPSSGWLQEANGLTTEYLAGVDAPDNSTAYAVGMNKTFLKYMAVNAMDEPSSDLISIYPNPTHNQLSVEFQTSQSEVSVSLYNVSGIELFNRHVAPGTAMIKLDLTNLKSGIYNLIIRTHNFIQTRKIVKL